jgi:hypothetical protein
MMLECVSVSAGRDSDPFDDSLAESGTYGDRHSRGPPGEREATGFTLPPFTDTHEKTCGFLQIAKSILDREENIASIIHRLSYRAYRDPELSQRARSYAVELKRYIERLRSILPRGAGPTSEDRPLESTLKSAIDSLHSDEAKLILIRFVLRHAGATSEILPSAGNQPKARTLNMLQRRVERERHKIADWINEHEAGLHESSSRRKRSGSEFDWRESEPLMPQGGIFARQGPLGDGVRARPTVFRR